MDAQVGGTIGCWQIWDMPTAHWECPFVGLDLELTGRRSNGAFEPHRTCSGCPASSG